MSTDSTAANITKNGWLSPTPNNRLQPGFMTGVSGMGYVLLKFIAPELVPNALALSPPVKTDLDSKLSLAL